MEIVDWFYGVAQPPQRLKVNITLKQNNDKSIRIRIPTKKLDMIKILQETFPYEVKGTFYFDHNYQFRSFEIRTDLNPLSAEGSDKWSIFFHTHPMKTARNLGLSYFSPPSVEDVMEIYDRILREREASANQCDHKTSRLGDISIIIASEGVWILQVDRSGFKRMTRTTFHGATPDETILETVLRETYNGFLIETLHEIYPHHGKKKLLNGQRVPDSVLEKLAQTVSRQYGLNMRFISWNKLAERGELSFTAETNNLIKYRE